MRPITKTPDEDSFESESPVLQLAVMKFAVVFPDADDIVDILRIAQIQPSVTWSKTDKKGGDYF
jgi:hypothetical protein